MSFYPFILKAEFLVPVLPRDARNRPMNLNGKAKKKGGEEEKKNRDIQRESERVGEREGEAEECRRTRRRKRVRLRNVPSLKFRSSLSRRKQTELASITGPRASMQNIRHWKWSKCSITGLEILPVSHFIRAVRPPVTVFRALVANHTSSVP